MKAFLDRPIEGQWPYLWIDATYLEVRRGRRIVSVAVIIAVGVNTDGRREVLGLELGTSEAEAIWTEFLRKLTRRGLRGIKLVVSDAHEGIKAAVSKVFSGYRVHFMRNAFVHAGRADDVSCPPPSPRRLTTTRQRPQVPNGAMAQWRRSEQAEGAQAR
ncbi:mutator family transposase [Rhizobium sp. PP-F2F-G48]|nr:mutator family transposase [Rhizobium sp. PP-F2F-G48]